MMKTVKLLPEETIFTAGTHAEISPLAPVSLPARSGGFFQNGCSASAPRTTKGALIYVVDDEDRLTELYTLFLKATGYIVRAFNLRTDAVAALTADRRKPDLLITDYYGLSMPVDRFMQCCLAVHPALRILMASGLDQTFAQSSSVSPDRFIQKPFTADEFLKEVRAALAA
jgi:DNA-binding NtrC family response regulator